MSRIVMDRAVFRRLYDQGLNDEQIADRCGVHSVTVWTHRRSLGLATNRAGFDWNTANLARLAEMARAGASAPEIAAELGATQPSVRSAAARRDIKIRPARAGVLTVADQMVIEMMQAGWKQTEIASEMAVSAASVQKRVGKLRKKGHLPPPATAGPVSAPAVEPSASAGASAGASAQATGRRPAVRVAPSRGAARRVTASLPGPAAAHSLDRRDGVIARLAGRHGPDLVQAVASVPVKGRYRKLASVAHAHTVPIRTVEAIWHQVRA